MRLFEVANKGIPRSQMPQIHVEDIKDDFDYRQGKLSLKKMKPVQTERVESEYKKAVEKIKNKQARPILLDKNLRIVNGHHRYDAYRHLGFDSVPAVIVDASLEDLMSKYQHTTEEAGAGAGGGAAGGTGGATGGDGGATSSSGDNGSADSGDAGDSGSDSAEATPPPSRGFFYVGGFAPYKSSKKKKKKKKKSSVEFGKSIYESLTMPKFDVEWDEAERYPEFRKIGKEAWIKLAKAGKAVTITDASDIENTDAGKPESFYDLEKDKQQRALQQIARGNVELPIVAVYSDGHKELIGGNTRLTAMMLRYGKATVWQFEVPDEVAELGESSNTVTFPGTHVKREYVTINGVKMLKDVWDYMSNDREHEHGDDDYGNAVKKDISNFTGDEDPRILKKAYRAELENFIDEFEDQDMDPQPFIDELNRLSENFADGKVKGKSRPGRVKKAGASCKGSVSSLRAKAKKYSGERGKMYHWCANMKSGKKKK